jgi:prevent-host-death family protein
MRKVGLFEAKQKLSELVERASEGEKIGITKHGKLAAMLVAPRSQLSAKEIFDQIEAIRKNARGTKKLNIKALIEEGRE